MQQSRLYGLFAPVIVALALIAGEQLFFRTQAVAGQLPPVNAHADYQLGGAYTPPSGVKIVARDSTASTVRGLYNICYINGFQVQPDEKRTWLKLHPTLILRDKKGRPVLDTAWDEMFVDTRTPEKRTAIAKIVGAVMDRCLAKGFDAVEIDNLDSFTRSGGRLTEDDAVATMRLFSDAAHARGLPIAQKNSAEISRRKSEMGTDFVVAEECNRFRECSLYTDVYGDHVIIIEYRKGDFARGCSSFPKLSIILRDRNLTGPSSASYVYKRC